MPPKSTGRRSVGWKKDAEARAKNASDRKRAKAGVDHKQFSNPGSSKTNNPATESRQLALDPYYFPHLFDIVMDRFSRNQLFTMRNVSKRWRYEVDKRLMRHIEVRDPSFGGANPLFFHAPVGRHVPVPWTPPTGGDDDQRVMRHRYIVDLPASLPSTSVEGATLVPYLGKIPVLRHFGGADIACDCETLVDFNIRAPLDVKCERYVVPSLACYECSYSQSLSNLTVRLNLLNYPTLKHVVLHFVKGITVCKSLEILLRRFSLRAADVTLTLVGLETSSRNLEAVVLRIAANLFCSPEVLLHSLKLRSIPEYIEEVGEEAFLIETRKIPSIW